MNKVIVMLKDDAIFEEREDLLDKLREVGFQVEELESLPNLLMVLDCTVEQFPFPEHEGIMLLENDAPIVKAQEEVTIQTLPTSGPWPKLRHTSRDRPWGDRIGALPYTGEFSCVRDGTGVDFYIVDTGIRPTHSEFAGRATSLDGWTPLHYHGTFCSSLAAGVTVGLAPGLLVWMAAGLRNADNTGSTADLLTAINACLTHYNGRSATNRPAVLSMSFSSSGSGSGSDIFASAVNACMAAGIVCLAAAANDAKWLNEWYAFPAENPDVICVGGINMDDGPYFRDGFGSNYGMQVDILGGSQNCRGADIADDNAMRSGSGTSYGTPYCAAIVACMLMGYRRLTSIAQVRQVKNYLYNQATFGRYRPDPRQEPMTPAIAYLDPGPGPYPPIPTLVPL